MPCAEFTSAINWSKQSTIAETFPVKAYFTKHYGYGDPQKKHRDTVHYASGEVFAAGTTKPYWLKGTLSVAKNTDTDGEMASSSDLKYDVEIYPDGGVLGEAVITYLLKRDGQPVDGLSATNVAATCANGVLLTGTTGSEVVTVGVARLAKIVNPP